MGVRRLKEFTPGIISFFKSAAIFLLGSFDTQLQYLFVILFADIILGVLTARRNKTFCWQYFLGRTVEKLVVYLVWICLGHACDIMINMPNAVRKVVMIVLITQEIISALKNTGTLGFENIVSPLRKALSQFINVEESKDQDQEQENKNNEQTT